MKKAFILMMLTMAMLVTSCHKDKTTAETTIDSVYSVETVVELTQIINEAEPYAYEIDDAVIDDALAQLDLYTKAMFPVIEQYLRDKDEAKFLEAQQEIMEKYKGAEDLYVALQRASFDHKLTPAQKSKVDDFYDQITARLKEIEAKASKS